MNPEQMLAMARVMRDKGVMPLDVYILTMPGQDCWMVPVPHDDSGEWPRGTDEHGNEVKLPPLQPVRLATQRSARSETEPE